MKLEEEGLNYEGQSVSKEKNGYSSKTVYPILTKLHIRSTGESIYWQADPNKHPDFVVGCRKGKSAIITKSCHKITSI